VADEAFEGVSIAVEGLPREILERCGFGHHASINAFSVLSSDSFNHSAISPF